VVMKKLENRLANLNSLPELSVKKPPGLAAERFRLMLGNCMAATAYFFTSFKTLLPWGLLSLSR
jgi:hypothetical protein